MVQMQQPGLRHPEDPEPVESTKLVAARLLAWLGAFLSPFVGGAVPALIALILARQAEADIRASEGFLLGASALPSVRRTAWTALGVAAAVVVAALLIWVLGLARAAGGSSYGDGVALLRPTRFRDRHPRELLVNRDSRGYPRAGSSRIAS